MHGVADERLGRGRPGQVREAFEVSEQKGPTGAGRAASRAVPPTAANSATSALNAPTGGASNAREE
jgi:hypothetical protein